jgi:ubiquitin C-terminal hydrolase
VLDGDNRYRCPLNRKLVRAERATRIQEPPNVLTIHLKRFEFAMFGKKVMRHVQFNPELDLAPYLHPSAAHGDHRCVCLLPAGWLVDVLVFDHIISVQPQQKTN